MALQLRRKVHESVVYIDRDSAPRIISTGMEFILEDLPVGTRVIYPNVPIKGLPNREAAIRYALNHPHDCDPLYAQLEPGMKVTVAIDDISMPLPPMKTPDIRQTALEILLDLLHANGVDDVHLIVAISLHRRMTEDEIRRMVGPRVFKEFWPDRLYNHDAEDPDGMVTIGETRHKEVLRLNRRAAESDLLIYLNYNFVPMNGGHKSVAVGLCDYESLRPHHEPQTILESDSYMDPANSELTRKINRMGKLVDEHLNVFHIETTVNNQMFKGELSFLTKNEDEFSAYERMKYEAMRFTMSKMPLAAKRKMYNSLTSDYEMIAVEAGRTEPVHERIISKSMQQYVVPVDGQCDILICPIPEMRDSHVLREKYEREFATNPSYIEMYRRGHAYHGAHPFYMWYWAENGRAHVGRVIAAGAENAHVPAAMGWERADNLTEAIAMARSHMGRSAQITMLHQPVIAICDMS